MFTRERPKLVSAALFGNFNRWENGSILCSIYYWSGCSRWSVRAGNSHGWFRAYLWIEPRLLQGCPLSGGTSKYGEFAGRKFLYGKPYNCEGLVGKRLSYSLGYSEINILWNSLFAMDRNQNSIGRLISSCALFGFLAYFFSLKIFKTQTAFSNPESIEIGRVWLKIKNLRFQEW